MLASPKRVHGAAVKAFDGTDMVIEGKGRVLWRLDHASRDGLYLYVVSPTEPEGAT